jgi:lipoprotein NlpD
MDPNTSRELKRYGAPAAFLVAVTVAVLLVKGGLEGGEEAPTTVAQRTTTVAGATTTSTTKLVLTTPSTTTTAEAEGDYYVIQSGDTLGSIAAKYDTTVEELVRLNPSVDPTALSIGERIRVG